MIGKIRSQCQRYPVMADGHGLAIQEAQAPKRGHVLTRIEFERKRDIGLCRTAPGFENAGARHLIMRQGRLGKTAQQFELMAALRSAGGVKTFARLRDQVALGHQFAERLASGNPADAEHIHQFPF